jgi:hypothetical protein
MIEIKWKTPLSVWHPGTPMGVNFRVSFDEDLGLRRAVQC